MNNRKEIYEHDLTIFATKISQSSTRLLNDAEI